MTLPNMAEVAQALVSIATLCTHSRIVCMYGVCVCVRAFVCMKQSGAAEFFETKKPSNIS
jgi:hypothetical protein